MLNALSTQKIDFTSHYLTFDNNVVTTCPKEGFWHKLARWVCVQQNPDLIRLHEYLVANPPVVEKGANEINISENIQALNDKFASANHHMWFVEKILTVINAVQKYFGFFSTRLYHYTPIVFAEPKVSPILKSVSLNNDYNIEFHWGASKNPSVTPLAHRHVPQLKFQKLTNGIINEIPLRLSPKHMNNCEVGLGYNRRDERFYLIANAGKVSVWKEGKRCATLDVDQKEGEERFSLETNVNYQLKMTMPGKRKINGKMINNEVCIASLGIKKPLI